ncbi:MAG: hypothetical protein KatS3mg102_2517 [Planctomycetota bacterium]|nr:MAG: hypothetical protein KatS3mg102_2517 [Planctomycetota bacterium]
MSEGASERAAGGATGSAASQPAGGEGMPSPVEELRAAIVRLGEIALRPLPLRAWREVTAGVGARIAELQARAEALEQVLVVLVFGGTGVGKSTLLNALAGEPVVAVSHEVRAFTDRLHVYHHADADVSFLLEGPARAVAGEPAVPRFDREAVVLHPHRAAELRDKVVVDAPDIDSIVERHRELVQSFLAHVDVVLYVTSPEKYKDRVGSRAIEALRGRKAFLFVLNQIDRVRPEQRPELLADFELVLRGMGFEAPRVLAIDARRGSAGEREAAGDLAVLDGLLRHRLRLAEVRAIKESGLLAHVRAMVRELALAVAPEGELAPLAARLEAARAALQAERAALAAALEREARAAAQRAWASAAREQLLARDAAAGGPYGLFVRLLRASTGGIPAAGDGAGPPPDGEARLRLEAAAARALERAHAVLRPLGVEAPALAAQQPAALAVEAEGAVRRRAALATAPAPAGPWRAVAVNALPAAAVAGALATLVAALLSDPRQVGLGTVAALLLVVLAICYAQHLVLRWLARRRLERRLHAELPAPAGPAPGASPGTAGGGPPAAAAPAGLAPLDHALAETSAALGAAAVQLRRLGALEEELERLRARTLRLPRELNW